MAFPAIPVIFVYMDIRKVVTVFLTAILLLFVNKGAFAQQNPRAMAYEAAKNHWVDSVYNALNPEERIGQLFMVAAYSGGKSYNEDAITKLINAHQIGGLIFMQGGPVRQANLTNKYQQMAQVPLLIGMDAEWGLGMRLDSIKDLPRQMMLGATHDTALAYRMGYAIGQQCRRLGVHIDFAPVVDVNNNPDNPVINARSFGSDKTWVARLGVAYMRGLQAAGVVACAKHFPGHGDTNVDSHKDLPVINKSLDQLDTLEFYPFKAMIRAGVKSVMVAHLDVPSLETEPHVPTTLSYNTVTNVLQNRLGFKGLIFTDALNMQGVAKYFPPGEADLRAFLAGNDVLLFSQDVPTAIAKIKSAIDSGKVTEADLEGRVKKILAAKYDAGLSSFRPIETNNITEDINQRVNTLRSQISGAAVTLVRDNNAVIYKVNKNLRVAYVGVNTDVSTQLYKELQDNLGNVTRILLPKGSPADSVKAITDIMDAYDAVVIGVHNVSFYPGNNYGLDASALSLLQEAQNRNNTMIALLGNAYAMQYFCEAPSVIVGYEDDSIMEHTVANVLLHKQKAKGRLPVVVCPESLVAAQPVKTTTTGSGIHTLQKVILPSDAGVVDDKALDKLDMFLQRCIVDGVFPGCRVFAAKDGKVFYDKSFGYYTYDKKHPVTEGTMYDMASCTKVLATTLAVMHLYEKHKLNLDKTIADYLPQARRTNKAYLTIRDLLLHQAGLKGWIPFYTATVNQSGQLEPGLYSTVPNKQYNVQVGDSMYLRNDYIDTMWNEIYASPLDNKGRYVYSDLDYYFLSAIVQHITGKPLDKYVEDEFYKPMGLTHITYNPLKKFSDSIIAPTESDAFFRHQLIRGYVHDPGAAMLGGVGGHAGIFATAQDVAAIFQMLLNKGSYNGKRYFNTATINYFTAYNSHLSRRGLGFDKPDPDPDDAGPAGERTTGYAFGHQGFTGTCVWADPGTGVVFVFLSNRVYPTSGNNKINHLNVRTVSQDYIYQSLGIPVNHNREAVYKMQLAGKK